MSRSFGNSVGFLFILGLSLIMSGCTSENNPTSIMLPSPTSLPKLSLQTPNTPTPTKTSLVTVTSTPATLFTPTKMPTLTIINARKLITSLSSDNGNCQFPCLWGFIPGESKIIDFKNFSYQFGNIKSGSSYTDFTWFGDVGGISFGYLIDDGEIFGSLAHRGTTSIEYLSLDLHGYNKKFGDNLNPLEKEFNYYLMYQILLNYGPPEQILVGPFPEEPDRPNDWTPFNLFLFYPHKGFSVEYIMTKQLFKEYFTGCPTQVREIIVTTWNSEKSKTIVDIAKNNPTFWGMSPERLDVYYKPIEEVLSQTPEDFYENYLHPNSNCIKAPMEMWPYR